MPQPKVARHKTALARTQLSRPIRVALRDHLIKPGVTVFDYGCGHGGDVRRLRRAGVRCAGWDPAFRPKVARRPADVVNLGYVVNVIEEPEQRVAALRGAWGLAERCLIVSARLNHDKRGLIADSFEDGCLTRIGTFQKFYDQRELRDWIDTSLECRSVSAAPGICYVFRDDEERQSFLASRYRRQAAAPRLRKSDLLFERHKPLFEALMTFLSDRGRLPAEDELTEAPELIAAAGSLKRAFRVVKLVTNAEEWARIREDRAQDLLVHMALARFEGRPRFGKLPRDLQRDVKAFFSTYKRATEEADRLLFSAGDMDVVDQAARQSPVGKLTGNALYVHTSALPHLAPVLRVYEACARNYVGHVDDANILKLHRRKPKISYLCYPNFDRDPHPALRESLSVSLHTFRIRFHDYRDSENPFILHRKELFVPASYPGRTKFARLTGQEERYGLYNASPHIGTCDAWAELVRQLGFRYCGHAMRRTTAI